MNRKKAEQEFHALFDRNCGRWSGIARCYAVPTERDDLLQEMLLQIWRSLPNFKQQAQIDTWAYRVALNTALGWDRKWKRRDEKLPRDRSMTWPHWLNLSRTQQMRSNEFWINSLQR